MIKYYKQLISFVFYFATPVITIVVADNATHFFCKKDLMGMQDYSCFWRSGNELSIYHLYITLKLLII